MYISRLLVLPLLISVSVAPVAAQSLPDKSDVPPSLPTAPQGTPAGVRSDQNPPPPLGKLVDVVAIEFISIAQVWAADTVVIVGAGRSFEWGLVQPEVAKFTQVCSYDHSGIGWSDSGPKDSCSLRVGEVHNVLKNAGIKGPYVFVGSSLGGLVARLYAGRYPEEVAGMVFVDHAFMFWASSGDAIVQPFPPPSMPVESHPDFNKLPSRDRELHLWVLSQTRYPAAVNTNGE